MKIILRIFCSLIVLSLVTCAVSSNEPDVEKIEYIKTALHYNVYFDEVNEGEGYLYFTDPHAVNISFDANFMESERIKYEKLSRLYSYTNSSFAMCGGDWLRSSNSRESALKMLSYIRAETKAWFDTCYLIVGNHDYNYQFAVEEGVNVRSEHELSNDEIVSVWFSEYGKTYYSFITESSRYYVFDSGIDWGHDELTELDIEQIAWYLGMLSGNDDKHIVLCPHMVYLSDDEMNPGSRVLIEISAAYNNRLKYDLDGITYDFSRKTGRVEYVISGHTHDSSNGVIEGIPYVTVCSSAKGSELPAADFVYADYTNRRLYLYRVGEGESREIDLAH